MGTVVRIATVPSTVDRRISVVCAETAPAVRQSDSSACFMPSMSRQCLRVRNKRRCYAFVPRKLLPIKSQAKQGEDARHVLHMGTSEKRTKCPSLADFLQQTRERKPQMT